MEQMENAHINPKRMIKLSLTNMLRLHNGERMVSSINGARKSRYPHAKKKDGSLSYTIYKN